MKVSVIATVLNEGEAIRKLLASLATQTRVPDEVVIVDGGSTDDTLSILRAASDSRLLAGPGPHLALQVLVEPGVNISRGRNLAAAAASGDVIASTDAGVRLSPDWLAELVAPFEQANPPQVVSGVFSPDPENIFEIAMSATVLPAVAELDPNRFLPSSRSVAFTREAWQAVGGYPEWLDYCEDLIFDLKLRRLYAPFGFAPNAVVYFRPRSNLRSYFKQYYLYARGDGKADLWRLRHLVRYASYLIGLPVIVLLGLLISPWLWLLGGGAAFAGHLLTPYRRLRPWLRPLSLGERLQAILWVPVIRVVGDVAKMVGYPVGWWWRLQRRQQCPQIFWRE